MSLTKVTNEMVPFFNRILKKFPQQITYSFAYGSGVFKQSNTNTNLKKMIDIIICVENPSHFHRDNIILNPKHYSSLKLLGHQFITGVQDQWDARVYFNALVPLEDGNLMKYGIVSQKALISDLLDWNYLYLAGRLHKPVEIIKPTSDSKLKSALQVNLHSAVHAALLLLPEEFSERTLYQTITALSYNGDFRMIFGEDKNKVANIVEPQIDYFRKLYAPVLQTLQNYVEIGATCSQDISPPAKIYHLNQLPKMAIKLMIKDWLKGSRNLRHDTDDVLRAIAYSQDDTAESLTKCLKSIVFASSVKQSFKGIFTAGITKSLRYSTNKIVKMISSLSPKSL